MGQKTLNRITPMKRTELPLFAAACAVSSEIEAYKGPLSDRLEKIEELHQNTERPVTDLVAEINRLEAEAEPLKARIELLTPRLTQAWLPARKEVYDAAEAFNDPLDALIERGTTALHSLLEHLAPGWTLSGNLSSYANGLRYAEELQHDRRARCRDLVNTNDLPHYISLTRDMVEYIGELPSLVHKAEEGIKKLEDAAKAVAKIFPAWVEPEESEALAAGAAA